MQVVEKNIKGFGLLGLLQDAVGQQEATQEEESVHTRVPVENNLGKDAIIPLRVQYY